MLRMINFLLIGLMLIGAGIVYDLKYEAERATAKVAKINRKIDAERDAIATLKAEWSLLNQPKRLQELAERHKSYLELDPLDPTQIGTIDDIPFKPAVPAAGATPQGGTPTGSQQALPMPVSPRPAVKGSVKLAQPEKTPEHTGSIGKFLDRLPPSGRASGPATTGSVPRASGAPMAIAPIQLIPKSVTPAPRPSEPQGKVIR